MIHKTACVQHNTELSIISDYMVGDLIKFHYIVNHDEKRISYSKIVKIIPKISKTNFIELHFLTENDKFIQQSQIDELMVKGEN